MWDTAGQERFKTLTKSYYNGAHGIAIVYDVTNQSSFDSVSAWIQEITKFTSESCLKILIANKNDMTNLRIISENDGKSLASEFSVTYFETSAKNEIGVNEAFGFMANKIWCFMNISNSFLLHSNHSILVKAKKKKVKISNKC